MTTEEEPTTETHLKFNLKALLAARGLTREQFRDLTGLHPNTIGSLMNDKYERWGRETLELCCKTLNCRIDELLIWE